jgi:carbon-monoxide dehydrogenase large subunit
MAARRRRRPDFGMTRDYGMYIGQRVQRKEDARFLTGQGRYVGDLRLPEMAYAAFLRSPHAHARIRGIDTAAATAMPGVLRILTGADWRAEGLGVSPVLWMITSRDGTPMNEAKRPILVSDRVRHVGDTIAVVVAETRLQALDAVDAIEVDYDPLPAVAMTTAALKPVAPLVHEQFGTNQVLDWDAGDREGVSKAFARAHHVTSLTLTNNRITAVPMEPRAIVGQYDATDDRYTLWSSTQNPHMVRKWLAENSLYVPEQRIRVVAPDVGGGFGQKIYHYPEEASLLWASRAVGRPVKWVSSRIENMTVDTHARDHVTTCRMAFDEEGRILAIDVDTVANLGAYLSPFAPCIPTYFYAPMLSELYKVPKIYCRVRCVYSHTTPVDAYRGAGRPECLFVVERLIENGARELGIDVMELRSRNLIQANEFPYTTAMRVTYDSGDFPSLVRKLEQMSDYPRLRKEQTELRKAGTLMGIGASAFLDCAGAGPSKLIAKQGARVGFWDVATVRVHPTGKVSVLCGSHSHGQAHGTTYAQIVADRLGCDIGDVDVVEGDTDRIPYGMGTYASRSLSVVGSAIAKGLDRVIAKGGRLAATMLECAERDIVFEPGRYVVSGTDRKVAFRDVAEMAYRGADYPEGFELGLEETVFHDPDAYNFPSAAHLCTVIVDPDTGKVTLRDYFAVDDVGLVINPMIVEGQIHGGLVQGIGQALMEDCRYDPASAQFLSATFMDYCMPRADDVPSFQLASQETPCPNNPLGVKGAGESGTIGAPVAVANAVVDALWHLGIRHIDMPLTPMRVWQAIQTARR